MASSGKSSSACGSERPPLDDPAVPTGKRRRIDSGSNDGTDEGEGAAKTNLDIIVENWANVHACLEQRDVVRCSRTCSRLHELCIDKDGKVHFNEIDWHVNKRNFDKFYRMLQNVRFDRIKAISLLVLLDTSPITLTVQQTTIIFSVLASPCCAFPLLKNLEISELGSFPDGLEVLFKDLGSKLANHSRALQALDIGCNAFSPPVFELMKPVLKKNVLTKLKLRDYVDDWQQNLIGNHDARELAELIISSTNLERLEIALGSDEADVRDERVSLWFKTKLVPAIRAGLNSGSHSANQSRLRYLSLMSILPDAITLLNKEELNILLNHFSGPHLSEINLNGNWMMIGSDAGPINLTADEFCHVLGAALR